MQHLSYNSMLVMLLNIVENEAYNATVMDSCCACSNKTLSLAPFFTLMQYAVIIMLQKSKQTSTRKQLGIIEIKKLGKQGESPTPADILLDIKFLNRSWV